MGVMGRTHANLYAQNSQVDLKYTFDLDQDLNEECSRLYGTDLVNNYMEILEDESLDAVSICTSDNSHLQVALEACKCKKHILIEKPLADNYKDSMLIVEAAKKAGVKLLVGHSLRWDPRYIVAKDRVSSGEIGDVIHFYARRFNSLENGKRLKGRTNVAMFLGVHDIDVVEWILGEKIVKVSAFQVKKKLKEVNIDTPDAITVNFQLESGSVGGMDFSWCLPSNHVEIDAKLDLIGTEGVLNIDIFNQGLNIYGRDKLVYPDTSYGVDSYGRISGVMTEEIQSFVEAVLYNKKLPISPEEAARAVKIVEAISESMETGQVITIE